MKVVIIDDDTRIINVISNLLSSGFPDIEINATAGDIESGYRAIIEHCPDLLFLDINLPDGTGFDLLQKLETVDFKIIFVTAFEEYALQAIKVSALDYILKPVDAEELYKAVSKGRELINQQEEQLKIKTLIDNFNGKNSLKRLVLHTSECVHFVNVDEIIRCEADSNYTFFYLTGKRKILVSKTIKEYTDLLRHSGFLRVHQSHLINTAFLDKYIKSDGGYLKMKDMSNVPISLNRKQEILKILETLNIG
ncbi:MAG: response regulator transcription factor [Bacteroidales bacterium]|nr:response regulator transcription factor [Bacteroidales bacterium]MBN2762367.1 response regulator transcription factor [Bacteroidales bacterium]